MSFLDLDEWLINLSRQVDLVYGPLVDAKEYPTGVDVVLVEGAIANTDHLSLIQTIRARSRLLVSFGDCAVTGNVTALRNPFGSAEPILQRCYVEAVEGQGEIPQEPGIVPPLLDRVIPVHAVVAVDIYLPGCPPPADRIRAVLASLLAGEMPHLAGQQIKFG
jgi:NAD-reducing hydrogenase small subunit